MDAGPLWYPRHPALTRVAVALTASVIIVAGLLSNVVGSSEREVDGNFLGLAAAALLPSMIYAIGVRTPRSVFVHGAILLGTTTFAWFFVFVDDDPMRGFWVVPAFVVTLCSSVHGARRDRHGR